MSSENNEAIITFPIKFVVDAQNAEDVKKEAEKLAEQGETGQEQGQTETVDTPESRRQMMEDLIEEKTKGLNAVTDEEKQTLTDLSQFVQTADKQGLQTLANFAKNPQGTMQGQLLGLLGKASIIGAVALAIIHSPELVKAVVNALGVKGGPLNQDYHRFFADEQQLGLDRDLQYRRAVGLDVIITSDNRGFLLQDPGFVGNNLVDVDTTRALRTSTKETKYGYVNGM